MDRIKGLGECGVAGCALTDEVIECECLTVRRRIEQLLEPVLVNVGRSVFRAGEGIGVREGTVVFDFIVFREIFEVEFPATSADESARDAEYGGHGERDVIDLADGVYELCCGEVAAVVR